MKKIFSFFIVFFVAGTIFPFANGGITLDGAIGSAFVFYGEEPNYPENEDFSRFVLEGDVSLGFVLDPAVIFTTGIVSLADFRASGSQHYNLIDYAFYGGIRIYPGLAGLRFEVDYMLGSRTDFIQIDTFDTTKNQCSWGNGFRLLFEYDFTFEKTGFAPIVGCSWRRMPRGNSTDNMISIYFRMSYR